MLKKAWEWMNSSVKREKFNEEKHKTCDECGGSGLDFIAGTCIKCDGNGFVVKTKADKTEEAIKYRNH